MTARRNGAERTGRLPVSQSGLVRLGIEADILSGRLPPDTVLNEEALAQRYAVSRTPVREAVLQLVQAGLLEKGVRRSAVVARLDVRRLVQVFETVSELEALCARFAARRISVAEKATLAELHELAAVALRENDELEYARLGRRFHRQIALATHNEELVELTDKASLRTVPYRVFQLKQPGRAAANQRDHGILLDALIAGDETTAERVMRGHVTVQGDVLAEFISRAPPQPAPRGSRHPVEPAL